MPSDMLKSLKSRLSRNKLMLRLYAGYRSLKLRSGGQDFFAEKIIERNSNSYIICKYYVFSKMELKDIRFTCNGTEKSYSVAEMNNFQHKYPGFKEQCINIGIIGFEELLPENSLELSITYNGRTQRISEELKLLPSEIEYFKQTKLEKLSRVKGVLASPSAQEGLVENASYFEGELSHTRYPKTGLYYNFLPDELAREFNIIPTQNVSAHDNGSLEDQMIRELAAKGVSDPLILDCGAGLKPRYRREVVNFEIVGYSTTDVIGINEKLPFRDNSFDGVFSAAVLEHVKDPFQSAREIIRVLKPNGVLMAFVPFLQPYHGYPHHYYNMTISGIRNLFEEAVEITELGTNLHPLDLMPWFIGSYVRSLDEKDSREFLNLRLKDLKNLDLLSDRGFYRNIPQQTREELAFVVKAIGYKK
jgi:SAM-dependent methyltransferase